MATQSGPTTLTTILPGAVFGPILAPTTLNSVQIIGRLVKGMPGTPRIGFEVVDVRDLVDIHIRAMTAPEAAGRRFLATGAFMWMLDAAKAERVLGWRARPAAATVVACGKSLIGHQVV